MVHFSIVVAVDRELGIGKGGTLPWHIKGDMAYFRDLTSGAGAAPGGVRNAVIMGRKTWESLPERFRPLPHRLNIVLTRDASYSLANGVLRAADLTGALEGALDAGATATFVIGGGEVFREALARPECANVYITRIDASYGCDTFFPPLEAEFSLAERSPPRLENGITYWFERYSR